VKITFEQLRDALVLANVIYMDGTRPDLFNSFRDDHDLTPYLQSAVDYLNDSVTHAQEGTP
jgi:hypothetical protein